MLFRTKYYLCESCSTINRGSLTHAVCPQCGEDAFLPLSASPFTLLGIDENNISPDLLEGQKNRIITWLTSKGDPNEKTMNNLIKRYLWAENVIKERVLTEKPSRYVTFLKNKHKHKIKKGKDKREVITEKKFLSKVVKSLLQQNVFSKVKGRLFKDENTEPVLIMLLWAGLLAVIILVPVGGITILGFTFFATTIFAGPWGIPITGGLTLLCGMMVYMRKKLTSKTRARLEQNIHKIIRPVYEYIAYLRDLRLEYSWLQKDTNEKFYDYFNEKQRQLQKREKDIIVNTVQEINEQVLSRLKDKVGKEKIKITDFWDILEKNSELFEVPISYAYMKKDYAKKQNAFKKHLMLKEIENDR